MRIKNRKERKKEWKGKKKREIEIGEWEDKKKTEKYKERERGRYIEKERDTKKQKERKIQRKTEERLTDICNWSDVPKVFSVAKKSGARRKETW